MANDLTFNQVSTILNGVLEQATGQKSIAATNTAQFVTQAQTALKIGYDPIMNAVSQVLGRTIFSVRPYTAKFRGIMKSEQQWGNHVRKINYVDKDFEDAQEWTLADGSAVDQYKINKPGVLQTNFYGFEVYQRSITTFRDQLENAFQGPDQMGEFFTGAMQNASDQIEQAHENMSRASMANFIGGKVAGDTSNVIHLLTEYNAYAGTSITSETMRAPENFEPFIKFAYARIKTIAGLMSERSTKFHVNVEGSEIMRHTPADKLKMYVLAQELNTIQTTVLSSVFNERFLRLVDYEEVNFWQSIDTPASVNVQASYLGTDGQIKTAGTATQTNGVFAVLFDEEAIGQTTNNRSVDVTPYNAAGKYWNTFFHFTERYWNDFTENGVVFLLD